MSIGEKLQTIAENEQKVYDAGYAAGQATGGDTDAAYNEGVHSVFEKMTLINYMFYRNYNKELYEAFITSNLSNVSFAQYVFQENDWVTEFIFSDTLQPNALHYMFQNCKTIKKVSGFEKLDSGVILSGVFDGCVALEDAGTVNFTKVKFAANTFRNCTALKELRITGIIELAVDLRDSPLTKESIESVIAALSDITEGTTLTFKQSAVNAAFETAGGSTSEEWLSLVATKPNWTITLA